MNPRSKYILETIVNDFHPMWFTSSMGTGISSLVLYNFPYYGYWLRICSYIMFACCVLLFLFFNIILIVSIFTFPRKWKALVFDINQNVFSGCYSMSYSSILGFLGLITSHDWTTALFTLWIINIAMSIGAAWFIIFVIHWKSNIETKDIHLSYLLPAVAQNVVASIGAGLYERLHPNLKLPNLILSFLCWSNGVALTFLIFSVYLWKLYVYKFPLNNPQSQFLIVGALGQASYFCNLFGINFYNYLVTYNPKFLTFNVESVSNHLLISLVDILTLLGQTVKLMFLFVSMFLVSNGYHFTVNALISIAVSKNYKFSKAWWSVTFPLGTMALANRELYTVFGFRAFRVVSAVYSVLLVLITTYCLIMSLIFEFPSLVFAYKADNDADSLKVVKQDLED